MRLPAMAFCRYSGVQRHPGYGVRVESNNFAEPSSAVAGKLRVEARRTHGASFVDDGELAGGTFVRQTELISAAPRMDSNCARAFLGIK